MSVRVRFAPSPTGHVHIGNMRAAIFNWLFARHEGGKFLLRIEDTDKERSTDEAKKTLFDAIEWLGLNYDEDVVFQSQRTDEHIKSAQILEQKRYAYRKEENDGRSPLVFRIPFFFKDFQYVREVGMTTLSVVPHVPVIIKHSGVAYGLLNKKGEVITQEACLAGFMDLRLFDNTGACVFDLRQNVEKVLAGEFTVNVTNVSKIEYVKREVYFDDIVKGRLSKPMEDMKDLVILRSDGLPVFHLANVCDDIAQNITHIIRGDDHVENTYRHIMLFYALGANPPRYAHLPMIVNQHGKPYSKRDGDAYVGDFKEKGFLADALFNYLCLLGWSPGNDKEKMSREEIINLFTLDRVKNGPAQMDIKKLTHLNWQYVSELPLDKFAEITAEFLSKKGLMPNVPEDFFREVCSLMQSRTNTFTDAMQWQYFFADEIEYDDKDAIKFLAKSGNGLILDALAAKLENSDFTIENIEKAIRQVEKEFSVQEGKLNQPVRAAVTGVVKGAGLYETMNIIGKEKCIRRLRKAVQKFQNS